MSCNDSMTESTPLRVPRVRRWWFVAALATAVPLVQGCATDPATEDEPNGELVISLTQPGPHGDIYKLASATFDISLASGKPVTVTGDDPTLLVTLPPGLASVQLRDGWSLQKSVDGGKTFQPVPALLGSLNPSPVRILANQPGFLRFDFLIRQTNGTLQITLGVVTEPRELAGGMFIDSATGDLASYALLQNRNLDFAVFFQLTSQETVTLDDGTKQRVYTAFSNGGAFGPIVPQPGAVAAEFYNDRVGTLSGKIAADLIGGDLTYTVAALPDGTIQLSGSLTGGATDIEFGPNPIDAILPTLDADGFPEDVFFYDSIAPFTQVSAPGTLSGQLRVRHIPPPL